MCIRSIITFHIPSTISYDDKSAFFCRFKVSLQFSDFLKRFEAFSLSEERDVIHAACIRLSEVDQIKKVTAMRVFLLYDVTSKTYYYRHFAPFLNLRTYTMKERKKGKKFNIFQ